MHLPFGMWIVAGNAPPGWAPPLLGNVMGLLTVHLWVRISLIKHNWRCQKFSLRLSGAPNPSTMGGCCRGCSRRAQPAHRPAEFQEVRVRKRLGLQRGNMASHDPKVAPKKWGNEMARDGGD